MVAATDTNNTNNEDARSTSSTLVNGEHGSNRNEEPEREPDSMRHGFDQELYEEDIIRFLYFSEKRHDANARPNIVARNALKDWVCDLSMGQVK